MMKLTKDRVSKLRCISCGSKQKRIAPIFDTITRNVLGFETICCNCGHMQKYAKPIENNLIDDSSIRSIIQGNISVGEVCCGSKHAFCPNKKCKWWNSCKRPVNPRPGDTPPRSVYHPSYREKPKPPRPGEKRAWCPPPPPERVEVHSMDNNIETKSGEPIKVETPRPENNRFL